MSRRRSQSAFTAVRSEGGILPTELLQRVALGDSSLPGLEPDDYHLDKSEQVGEAINRSWARLLGCWTTFREAAQKAPTTDKTATQLTRNRLLLPLFQELGYGRLMPGKSGSAG